MIVVDTNILAYLFLKGEYSSQAETLLRQDAQWAAPVLWRSEFRNILAHYLRREILSLTQCQEIMREAMTLMKGREYEVASFQVLKLVASSDCSDYDCELVALAQDLDVELITVDKKILIEFPSIAVSMDDTIA
jgi:predicted nucleic acid-binding protein